MNRKNTPKLRFKEFEKADPWEQRKLGELCERVTRKNKTGESDLPLTIASQYGLIDQRDFFNKVVAAKDMSNYYLLKKGEFAYNKSYSNGYDFGSIKRLNAYEQGCLSTLYICFGITSDDIESDYLECFFDTLKWYSDITMICAEGARNHGLLNVDTKAFFDEVTIEMPSSKEEQRKISSYLNNLDNLITLHQRKYEKLKKVKNAYLDEMFPKNGERFPKRRFPGFTDPWEQRKLGEVSERVQGNDGRMDLPTLTISAANGWMSQEDRFSGNIAGKEQKNYTLLHKGELSYNHGNSKLAKYGTVFSLESYEEALVPRVYHSFRMIDADASFIEYYFSTKIPDRELAKLISSGARMDGLLNISFDEFMGIKINLPSIQEQQKISYYLRQLDNLITLHQRELDKLKKLKAAYLDAMFVGGK